MANPSFKALYPGSFDALTYGHLDIISRGSRVFDTLIVAIAHNAEKNPVFSVEERLDALKSEIGHLVNVEVTSFSGLTVDYAISIGAQIIIRGLRALKDEASGGGCWKTGAAKGLAIRVAEDRPNVEAASGARDVENTNEEQKPKLRHHVLGSIKQETAGGANKNRRPKSLHVLPIPTFLRSCLEIELNHMQPSGS